MKKLLKANKKLLIPALAMVLALVFPITSVANGVLINSPEPTAEPVPMSGVNHEIEVGEDFPILFDALFEDLDEEPPVVDEEPPVVDEEPPVADEEPPVADEEPPVADEEPPVADEEPPVADEEPPVADAEPPVVDEEPVLVEPAELLVDEFQYSYTIDRDDDFGGDVVIAVEDLLVDDELVGVRVIGLSPGFNILNLSVSALADGEVVDSVSIHRTVLVLEDEEESLNLIGLVYLDAEGDVMTGAHDLVIGESMTLYFGLEYDCGTIDNIAVGLRDVDTLVRLISTYTMLDEDGVPYYLYIETVNNDEGGILALTLTGRRLGTTPVESKLAFEDNTIAEDYTTALVTINVVNEAGGGGNNDAGGVQTGDTTSVALYVITGLLSLAGLSVILYKRFKKVTN